MYNLKNVTLDFSQHSSLENMIVDQPVAVMPVELAKNLLKMYAEKLRYATGTEIINKHIASLKEFAINNDLQGALGASLSWITERELINNVSQGNWDAYAVREQEPVNELA